MALRWVRTIDQAPHMFASGDEENSDWLLYCGGWLAGPRHDPHWALNGPHSPQAPLEQQGWTDSIDDAKAKLVSAWCVWLGWAALPAPDVPEMPPTS